MNAAEQANVVSPSGLNLLFIVGNREGDQTPTKKYYNLFRVAIAIYIILIILIILASEDARTTSQTPIFLPLKYPHNNLIKY